MTTRPGWGPEPSGSKTSTGGSELDAIAIAEGDDAVDGTRRDLVEQRGRAARRRGDLAGPVDDALEHELAGVARGEHGDVAIGAGRGAHRRAHQRHVDRGPR